ncbi:MAG: hypothetical protein ABII88_01205 [Candidatus Omnitrophota bacterium]
MREILLNIGGIAVLVANGNEEFISLLKDKYKDFVMECSGLENIRIEMNNKRIENETPRITIDKDEQQYSIIGDEFLGKLNIEDKRCVVYMRNNESLFDTFLRVLFSVLLVYQEGFLVHASGISREGKGFLFPGASEHGKTTTARRFCESVIFSDELVIVKKQDDGFYLFPSPFAGEFVGSNMNEPARLEKVFILTREHIGVTEKVKDFESFLSLLERIFFFASDAVLNQKLIDLAKQLCTRVACFKMNIMEEKNLERIFDEISKDDDRAQCPGSLAGN